MSEILKDADLQKSVSEKLLWQMTKAEYESVYGAPKGNSTVTGKFSRHKQAVEVALNRGFSVPREVLKDYPDLDV